MTFPRIFAVGLAACALLACDNGEAEREKAAQAAADAAKQAEEAAAKASQGMGQGGEQLAKNMQGVAQGVAQGMAKMVSGMQAASAGRAVVEPLHFKALYEVMPTPRGWEMAKPTGQTVNMPYTFSQAEAKYTDDDARVKVNIVDGGWHQMMLAPYAMFLKAGFERETDTGYEKTTTINGYPGWEKWDSAKNKGEMNLIVEDRFLVQFNGEQLEQMEDLRAFADATKFSVLVDAAEKAAKDLAAAKEAAAGQ